MMGDSDPAEVSGAPADDASAVTQAVPFTGDPDIDARPSSSSSSPSSLLRPGTDEDDGSADPLGEYEGFGLRWYSDEDPDEREQFDPRHGHREIDHPDLDRLREFCMLLPEAGEVAPFGLPNFRVSGRAFAMFEFRDTRPTLLFKAEAEAQEQLVQRQGFWPHPDNGEYGWTFVYLDIGLDWEMEIDVLVTASYRLVAKPEQVIALDNLLRED